ncbi:MAG: type II toxin-antitoxin system HipA family toxin [Acidimicrobiales bacterium]|nr:type II toxin-antitoxin system HipA family toxin [Acidimicrobiales bacterium]MYG62590.1 type II toxin-antitoxin system HipA family toxin [Acidimicrobiales bacterium]
MTGPLAVMLDGRVIGMIDRSATRRGTVSFAYSNDHLHSSARPVPLSLSLPPTRQRHADGSVETWFAGLLPDNADLLRHWQQVTGAASTAPLDLLATPMGLDCAGAVQICPTALLDAALSRGGSHEPLSAGDVARQLSAIRQRTHLATGTFAPGYFSLAGAQAKIALHLHDGIWHQPSGTAATTHILKPAVFMTQHQAVIEHLSMATARRLGLPAANTSVAVFDGYDTIIVERYDRRRVGGRVLRLHQEDLCQALGLAPSLRYEQHGGPSLPQVVAMLRRHSTSPADDLADLIDALIYQWVIGAPDGHAKNFSILLDGAEVRLAPMYDVCSVLPYLALDETVGHAFALGGSHSVAPEQAAAHWTRFAHDAGLHADDLLARLADIVSAVPDACAAEATLLSSNHASSPRVSLLLERLTARAHACLRQLG